jgi:hypothetical protein
MNDDGFLSEMLAWRQMLGSRPELAAATRKQLEGWLNWQRSQPPVVSKPQIVVSAELSCGEDLMAHVGIAQLLALGRVRCGLVLSFPTKDLARIVRAWARREGCHGLIQIVDRSEWLELLENLPTDTPLARFQGMAVLSPQSLKTMFVTRHPWDLLPAAEGEGRERVPFLYGRGYFGRAGDFAGVDLNRPTPDYSISAHELLDYAPAELGFPEEPWVPGPRNNWSKANFSVELAPSHEGSIGLPGIEVGDELIIRTDSYPMASEVIERRFSRLCPPDKPMEVNPSSSMLTTAPKIARLEAYKANGQIVGTNLLLRVPPTELQPWMVSAYLNRGGGGNAVVRAFSEGLGCRLAYAEDEPEILRDIPVVWGVLRQSDRILAQAKAQMMYFFYIDHAYFNRGHGKSYRITRNRYEAGPVRKCPPDRLAQLAIEVQPWQTSGREIIVCPPTDYFMEAHGCSDWLDTTLAKLSGITDRPITIREKPQPGETAIPLKAALKTAHALVTHSSNVAIEAACLGTPVFVNPASAAAPVGLTDLSRIETPVYPDREPWLAHLAYNQFSINEIRTNTAWRLLLELEEREFA